MADQSVAAPAAYQLDPAVRARILSESPRAQAMLKIEQQRQAFMELWGCPYGSIALSQAEPDAGP